MTVEKYQGALTGLAIGDALGTTLEFTVPGTFTPIRDMTGGGPFHLHPGEWTDDTSMALCLAESLIEKRRFDPVDQLERYLRWYKSGHLSSTGICFDIGGTTSRALQLFASSGEPYCGPKDPTSSGNGSIMRLAPIPLFFAKNPLLAITLSGESSKTTHQSPICIDACRYLGGLIVGALNGFGKEEILSPHFSPVKGIWETSPLCPEIEEVASGSFKRKSPPEIKGSGYAAESLEAALWAFWSTKTFEKGLLAAVNLGDDADTTGAVYGQLAGTFYGISRIPGRWIEKLARLDLILEFASKLFELSQTHRFEIDIN
ncbi:ADP-ribosylglycohydrolase [Candidatus Zixiibacteriota bacterium]|nr:ADP-ribosylglycohydrolase [candidate division Zixibacteria bacterium]